MSNPWDGRFSEAMAEDFIRFNTGLPIEARLFEADLRASRAHVIMLNERGLLGDDEAARLDAAMGSILVDWRAGRIALKPELEDIHMNLEALLIERLGDAARKVHTARSRNDQQAVAQRLYFKESTLGLAGAVLALQRAILDHCSTHGLLVMPSYTHLQRAEPTRYGHWLSTYVAMLQRDGERLVDAVRRADECPLGACASTGTSLPIDRERTASLLGFGRPTLHSIDSVSDRDYLVEFASVGALLMVHLSRLAEEIILFTSQEFGFLRLADRYCTGSSIMPQKKNPDVLELIRGKAATAIGGATSLLAILKGLPLGYNKDLQEDKTSWFSVLDACVQSVGILAGVVGTMTPVAGRMAEATRGGHLVATEYANYLAGRGVPFRTAHRVVGALVKAAEARGVDLGELGLDVLREAAPEFSADVLEIRPESAASLKNSAGSCGDLAFEALLGRLRERIEETGRAIAGLERARPSGVAPPQGRSS